MHSDSLDTYMCYIIGFSNRRVWDNNKDAVYIKIIGYPLLASNLYFYMVWIISTSLNQRLDCFLPQYRKYVPYYKKEEIAVNIYWSYIANPQKLWKFSCVNNCIIQYACSCLLAFDKFKYTIVGYDLCQINHKIIPLIYDSAHKI